MLYENFTDSVGVEKGNSSTVTLLKHIKFLQERIYAQ